MNLHKNTMIRKSTGEIENFSSDKFKRSLAHAGLIQKESEDVAGELSSQINSNDITTEDIYKRTKEIVFRKSHLAGVKYSLKNAILELGPSGFVFEKFIAKNLEAEKYQTEINLNLVGHCVGHEIDFKATRDGHKILGECKFHNHQETKNDIKIALYVKARMDDLRANPENQFDDFYLISNTSFSKDAIKYSQCAGLKLLGYNYPPERNLYQMIEMHKHYPITCIPWLKKNEISDLISKNIILTHDLYEQVDILKKYGYQQSQIDHFKEIYLQFLSKA